MKYDEIWGYTLVNVPLNQSIEPWLRQEAEERRILGRQEAEEARPLAESGARCPG